LAECVEHIVDSRDVALDAEDYNTKKGRTWRA
jgi:hypothetical protein